MHHGLRSRAARGGDDRRSVDLEEPDRLGRDPPPAKDLVGARQRPCGAGRYRGTRQPRRLVVGIRRRSTNRQPLAQSRAGAGNDGRLRPHEQDVLQSSGFRFVGSTICYAFMATGMVDDHLVTYRSRNALMQNTRRNSWRLVDAKQGTNLAVPCPTASGARPSSATANSNPVRSTHTPRCCRSRAFRVTENAAAGIPTAVDGRAGDERSGDRHPRRIRRIAGFAAGGCVAEQQAACRAPATAMAAAITCWGPRRCWRRPR